MLEFKGKTIIFVVPTIFGFADAIKQELERVGLTVYDFSPILDNQFRYKNIWQRLHNLYRKAIHNDYQNKRRLRTNAIENLFITAIAEIPKVDFALVIRPDWFPLQFVEEICNRSKLSVGYQWDGLKRYSEIDKYLNKFDRFFVFDSRDVTQNNLPLTNFFIPSDTREEAHPCSEMAYFIGSYEKSRVLEAATIANALQDLGVNLNFIIMRRNKTNLKVINKTNFKIIHSYVSYLQNLENVKKSSILVDVQSPVHDGLSFRVFEALNYNKKLITTNSAVKNYDFYDPANIFIWDNDNSSDLGVFLNIPTRPVAKKIKNKYSFDNWIRYVLDWGPYEPIGLNKSN